MHIFYIVVGVCFIGIGICLWILQQEEANPQNAVKKLSPDEVRKFEHAQVHGHKGGAQNSQTPPIPAAFARAPKTKSSLTNSDPTKEKQGLFARVFSGKKNKKLDLSLNNINADHGIGMPEPKPVKAGLFSKLTRKIKLGKGRVNPQDDIPEPTSFANLSEHTNQNDTAEENNQTQDNNTGTASMTTTHTPPDHEPVSGQNITYKDPFNNPAAEAQKRENAASIQLDNIKEKYEKLDSMFKEKSDQLEQNQQTLNNELKNREDFFKLKAILESEIKEVKERAKDLQQSLKNAKMETEQQKIQAQQLKDKVADLEDAVLTKNLELDRFKNDEPPSKTIPIVDSRDEKPIDNPFEKDIRTEDEGVVKFNQQEEAQEPKDQTQEKPDPDPEEDTKSPG